MHDNPRGHEFRDEPNGRGSLWNGFHPGIGEHVRHSCHVGKGIQQDFSIQWTWPCFISSGSDKHRDQFF